MTEHTGLPVAKYKAQSQAKVVAVNANKISEEELLRRMDAMKEDPEVDQRWLAIARTDIEKGFMALNRSIFKPGRVRLSIDDDVDER